MNGQFTDNVRVTDANRDGFDLAQSQYDQRQHGSTV